MNNTIPNFGEETGEILLETGKKVIKNVTKGTVQAVKAQITGKQVGDVDQVDQTTKTQDNKKIDPVTGKPIISKKTLAQLNQQVAQLAQMRIKKVREELEKQRLKIQGTEKRAQGKEGTGPEVPAVPEEPKEDVISKVLKASKSTGEYGKNIGG